MILIEVLGRRGHVVHRVRTTGPDTIIGRAYDSDVILDDPYVDAHAVRLTVGEDGAIVLHDLGASNPIYVANAALELEACPLAEGDLVRIGRTRLRVVRESTGVEPALVERAGRLGALMGRRAAAPVTAAVFVVLWSISSYFTGIEEFTAAARTGEVVGLFMLVAMWAGCWALATRLAQGRSAFLEHSAWTLLVGTVALPVTTLIAVLAFLWPGMWTDALWPLFAIMVLLFLLDAHLGLATRFGGRARTALALSVSLALVGLVYVLDAVDPVYEAPVQNALGALYPMPEGLIPATSAEDFLASTSALEEELAGMVDES